MAELTLPPPERVESSASWGDVLRSLLFYGAFYGASVLYVVAACAAMPLGARFFRRVVESWSAFHRLCAGRILGIALVVEGRAPRDGALVALKHESFFEAIDLPYLLDHPGIFAKAELFSIPLWGWVGRTYGLIPVEREQGAKALRAMIGAAKALSAQGRVIAIFPEGTRVPHGRIAPLQSGFAGLYKLIGLPVVPVALDSGPLYHRRWKRRGTITVRFGEAIPAGLPRDEIEARVRDAINALNDPDLRLPQPTD